MSAKIERIVPDPIEPTVTPAPAGWVAAGIGHIRRRPRLAAGIAAGLVVAIVAARLAGNGPVAVPTAKPTQTVTTAAAVVQPMGRVLTVNGSLAAWDELSIGTETGGLAIAEVLVEQGDSVTKGQMLARLDDAVLKAQLAQADAAVAQSEAVVRKAQAGAANAASDARRAKELVKNGYISAQLVEQRDTLAVAAQADVQVARQALETAKALRNERMAKLQQSEIRAPSNGIVSKRMAALGTVVSVGQEIFRIIRDGKIELRAEVPETELSRLQVGQKVAITTGGRDAAQFEGQIWLIGATVDPQTRIGLVYVALPNSPALKPGMFVHGEVTTGTGDALQVPEAALVFKDGKTAIFVVGPDNRVKQHAVEVGARRDGVVEIRSGASPGDQVAVAGAGYLNDGDLVRIENPDSTAAPPAGAAR